MKSITGPIRHTDHTFLVLDGLRGVAAISVMLYHYSMTMSYGQVQRMANAGLAVDFFFVLSGFVIAYAYEQNLLSRKMVGEFMLRRLIRLYPLYFVGVTLPLAILTAKYATGKLPCSFSAFLASYGLNAFFIPTPSPIAPTCSGLAMPRTAVFPLNGPAWTLSLEVGINFIYALFCRHLTSPRLAALAFLSGLGLTAAIWYYGNAGGWQQSDYFAGWARMAWSFFIGVLLYRHYHSKIHSQLPAWVGVLLAIILLGIFLCPQENGFYTFINCIIVMPCLVWIGACTKIWEPLRRLYAWLGKIS